MLMISLIQISTIIYAHAFIISTLLGRKHQIIVLAAPFSFAESKLSNIPRPDVYQTILSHAFFGE